MTKLFSIQQELNVPKKQYNSFGKYSYRSAEDILEALKPLLAKHESTLVIQDKIAEVGGWVFVEATATLTDDKTGQLWSATASARHADVQKGMQEAQITGSASSYARKYALNGLFAIDDTKDADTTNTGGNNAPRKAPSADLKEPATDAQKDRIFEFWQDGLVGKGMDEQQVRTYIDKMSKTAAGVIIGRVKTESEAA